MAAAKPKPEQGEGPDKRKPSVRVRAGTLLQAVKDVAEVVEGKASVPILAFLHFQSRDGAIVLTGTNLDCWVSRTCASDDRDGPGSSEWVQSIRPFAITLPAKTLKAVLSELDSDAMVTLTAPEAGETRAVLAAGRARFKLLCLPTEDFVLMPDFTPSASFELPCSVLADSFAAVAHAISSEETRYYLNGIYLHTFQVEGEALQLRLAATDGHRLARLALDPPDGGASFPKAIVFRGTIGLLGGLLDEAVKLAAKDKGAPPTILIEAAGELAGGMVRYSIEMADGEEVCVMAKTVDGDFPDYTRVIPHDPPLWVMVERAALAEAIKRVNVITSEKTRAVKAVFSADKLELVVTTAEVGEAREELPCAYEGPDVTLGFNGVYWRQALLALACDDVSMGFSEDPFGPVLLRKAGLDADGEDAERDRLVQVLMPLRVA